MKLTPEAEEKRKLTIEAKKAEFATQTVKIDENWQIIRFDELNWEIQYQNKPRGYYGRLIAAFQALPSKMLNQEARGNLVAILETHRDIEKRISVALDSH